MTFFKKKNDKILDLTEKYKRDQERVEHLKEEAGDKKDSGTSSAFDFLGNMANASSSENTTENYPVLGQPEKARELSKKLLNLTEKIEDISNQIYHLQQRIELLERKVGVGSY